MVLCLIALPIFAVLGLFSIKYRKLAKDALDCLFKTVTLRKCESGLDDRIRAGITGSILRVSPKTAGFVYKHYQIISWLILILFIWSAYEGGIGTYNYVKYGDCNGPDKTGFCIFDPLQHNTGCSELDVEKPEVREYPQITEYEPIIGDPNANLTIIEFGCYACEYTKKAEATVKEVLDKYDGQVNVQFRTVIIPGHAQALESALAAECANDQGKYLEYHEILFKNDDHSNESLRKYAEELQLDLEQYDKCFTEQTHKQEIEQDTDAGAKASIQGTPTFFINKEVIVGPKPFKTFKEIIDKELK